MYRRSLAPLLRLIVAALAIFVLYQGWLKPAYHAPRPTPSTTNGEEPPTTMDSRPTTTAIPLDPQIPSARLGDPGEAPNSKLQAIRDELEKGNLGEAASRLHRLPTEVLAHERARKYVATLWNNLGVQQEQSGGIEVSVKAFQKAVAIDRASSVAHLNLTHAYWGLRHPSLTPEFLQKVIRLIPREPFPHLALAELLLEKGEVETAMRHLNQVVEQAQRDPTLQSYAHSLTAKIRLAAQSDPHKLFLANQPGKGNAQGLIARSQDGAAQILQTNVASRPAPIISTAKVTRSKETEQHSDLQQQEHFIARFAGDKDEEAWVRVRAILEFAYLDICQKFGHFPSAPLMVVLHTAETFTNRTGSPEWADKLYDAASNEIHLPVRGALDDLAWLSRVLRHEFVHALLRDKMGAHLVKVPTWLVEGLAILLAEDPWPDLEGAREKGPALIPLTSLESPWTNLAADTRLAAYLEASAAAQNLVDRYSMFKVRQLMNLLTTGQPLDAAMQDKLSLSYEQFQRQWVETLNAKQRSGNS